MEKILKNKWTYIIAILLLGIIFYGVKRNSKPEVFSTVEKGDMLEATYAVGTVKADRIYNLKTGVNSKMVERMVRIGQRVKKGDPLVRLDSFPTFFAPFDGVITVLNYEIGELVFAQSTVLTLVNDKTLYLELSLDERSLNKIKIGNEAKITFDNQKKISTGKIRAIFSNADQFYVHIDFDQNDLVLVPGMTCDVSIITRKFLNSILVPLEALSFENTVTLKNKEKTVVKLNILYRDNKFAVVENPELSEGQKLLILDESKAPKVKLANKSSGGGH